MQFKKTFDLDRDIARERAHANGTPHPHPIIESPDLCEQLAATVDHEGMPLEIRRAANHAEGLHDPLHFVETAEITADGCQYREPDLACRQLTLFRIEVFADPANDQRGVVAYRAVTGYIQIFTVLQT